MDKDEALDLLGFTSDEENPAISVINEAWNVYFYKFQEIPEVTKKISIHQIKTIFDSCVVPAIDKVRELDRANLIGE